MNRSLTRRELIRLTAAAPLVLALCGTVQAAPPLPRRRALLVGVSRYENGASKRWCDLNTEPDVFTLRSVLKSRFGFKDDEIFTLTTPAQTTRAAIVAAIQTRLVAWAKPGDTIYFHYSGHGASRHAGDGMPVSTLVPHDHREPGDKAGENHIASGDLLKLFGAVKQKMTLPGKTAPDGSLFLTFDSCHSGKIVRSASRVRGERSDLQPPAPANAKPVAPDADTPLAFLAKTKTRGENTDALGTGFAALFACRYDQSASEIAGVKRLERSAKTGEVVEKTGNMGRFTYFLAKTLAESTKTTTYNDVWDLVRGNLSAAGYNDQTPDLRGDGNYLLFGGAGPERTVTVPAEWEPNLEKPGEATLLLRAGQLTGVTEGSTYALFRVGDDPKTATPVTTATVQTVNLGSAVVLPTAKLPDRKSLRAVETKHIYPNDALLVSVADIRAHPGGAAIIAVLQDLAQKDVGLLALTDNTAIAALAVTRTDTLARATGKTRDENQNDYAAPGFAIERVAEGTVVRVIPDSAEQNAAAVAEVVRTTLQDTARRRILESLQNNENGTGQIVGNPDTPPAGVGKGGDGVHVVMRLLPCTTTVKKKYGRDYTAFAAYKRSETNARGEYADKEAFLIEVENTGTQRAFLNILDLSPDGTINPIYPPANPKLQAYDPAIDPGTKRVLSVNGEPYVIRMAEPFGSEAFKLIATDTELDFSPLLSAARARDGATTDARKRAEGTPLGVLFKNINEGKRAATTDIPANDSQYCTGTMVLTVRPAGGVSPDARPKSNARPPARPPTTSRGAD